MQFLLERNQAMEAELTSVKSKFNRLAGVLQEQRGAIQLLARTTGQQIALSDIPTLSDDDDMFSLPSRPSSTTVDLHGLSATFLLIST